MNVSALSSPLQGEVIEGMSYNKLVEKLLDFRSAMTAASDEGKQDEETAGIGPSVANVGAESRGNGGQQEHPMNDASTTEEEAVGSARASGDDGSVVVGDKCGPLGAESAASRSSVSPGQEGSDSTPHRGGTPSDACARATSSAMTDEESSEVAVALKEGQVAEDFFRETASQLTYFGLSRLHQEVRDVAHCASVLAILCKNHACCSGLGASLIRSIILPSRRFASVSCAFSFATTTSARCSSTRASCIYS